MALIVTHSCLKQKLTLNLPLFLMANCVFLKLKARSMDRIQVQDEENEKILITRPVKRRRLRAAAQKKAAAEQQAASARVILDALGAKWNRQNSPIWFSLVASEDQKGDTSLPQISACYLRINDGKMPVSFIQKYLVKKLDLTSEADVRSPLPGGDHVAGSACSTNITAS